MKLHELFKINMDLVPYSQEMVEKHIHDYSQRSWSVFQKTDQLLLLESNADIMGRIYYIPFIKSTDEYAGRYLEFTESLYWKPAGYVEFHRTRILMSSTSTKTYLFSTEVFTPHIRLSKLLRGTGLAERLYRHQTTLGRSLITSNHTKAAAMLWDKIGYITVKLPKGSQSKLQVCDENASEQVFKLILGAGVNLKSI